MKRKLPWFLVITASTLFLAYQSGPLPENTGAPGEQTCYRSGCHVNNGSGNATVFLRLQDQSTAYRNADTLMLELGFETTFSNEHGFQVVALDSNNQNIGQWIPGSSNQYQEISGTTLSNRKYLEHTNTGTTANSWQVQWASPANYQGAITFYASMLETNNSNNTLGDTLYNAQLSLGFDTSSDLITHPHIQLPYRIVVNGNHLIFTNTAGEPLKAGIYALNGKRIEVVNSEGFSTTRVSLQSGIYILGVENMASGEVMTEKVMVR